MRVEALPDPLVVDASVGLKWVVDEPGSNAAVVLPSRHVSSRPSVSR